MNTEIRNSVDAFFKTFDSWVMSIGLPNDIKPLGEITSQEYIDSLHTFYKKLGIENTISFRQWVESFYNKNEIDFDYLNLMSTDEWIKLYLKVFVKYIKEDKIKA